MIGIAICCLGWVIVFGQTIRDTPPEDYLIWVGAWLVGLGCHLKIYVTIP